jgi:hypothetical protein
MIELMRKRKEGEEADLTGKGYLNLRARGIKISAKIRCL